jgi:hypothetical protein
LKVVPGADAWVGALAVCRGSDLAASGAGDGKVQLWALEEDNKHLRALHSLPVVSKLMILRYSLNIRGNSIQEFLHPLAISKGDNFGYCQYVGAVGSFYMVIS